MQTNSFKVIGHAQQNGYVHRDINLMNILVKKNDHGYGLRGLLVDYEYAIHHNVLDSDLVGNGRCNVGCLIFL